MPNRRIASCTAVMVASVFALPVFAQGPPDYGFEWRTVGAPGNPNARPRDFLFLRVDGHGPVGRVNRPYRLTETKITVADQLEFVQAYSPYYPEGIHDSSFWGRHIYNERNDPNDPGWYAPSGSERYPGEMGWIHAARFSNWLHNGKNPEQWAFESGAYDMSTFSQLPNGDWVGQERRSPGARFWIPSLDEWIKGMYYDPEQWGPGRDGYWMYPISDNVPPVSGFPWTPGAQTSAGFFEGWFGEDIDVGSYPHATSPWGLLDGSGGGGEWLEDDLSQSGFRRAKGTSTGGSYPLLDDRLDWIGFGSTTSSGALRLASSVPSTTTVLPMVFTLAFTLARRRPAR